MTIPKSEQYPGAAIIPWRYTSPTGQPTYYLGTNKPEIIVIHVAEGWAATSKKWATEGYFGASYHFMVDEGGAIMQHLGFKDGGYHAGVPSGRTGKDAPRFRLWKGDSVNVNNYSIGIEHEGFAGGVFEPIQIVRSAALTKWLCQTLNIPRDREHIIGHYEVDPVNRPFDPGKTFPWNQYISLVNDDGGNELNETEREEFQLMKVRMTNIEALLFGSAKTGAEAVAYAKEEVRKGHIWDTRLAALETAGDTVARQQLSRHLAAAHGGSGGPYAPLAHIHRLPPTTGDTTEPKG